MALVDPKFLQAKPPANKDVAKSQGQSAAKKLACKDATGQEKCECSYKVDLSMAAMKLPNVLGYVRDVLNAKGKLERCIGESHLDPENEKPRL